MSTVLALSSDWLALRRSGMVAASWAALMASTPLAHVGKRNIVSMTLRPSAFACAICASRAARRAASNCPRAGISVGQSAHRRIQRVPVASVHWRVVLERGACRGAGEEGAGGGGGGDLSPGPPGGGGAGGGGRGRPRRGGGGGG